MIVVSAFRLGAGAKTRHSARAISGWTAENTLETESRRADTEMPATIALSWFRTEAELVAKCRSQLVDGGSERDPLRCGQSTRIGLRQRPPGEVHHAVDETNSGPAEPLRHLSHGRRVSGRLTADGAGEDWERRVDRLTESQHSEPVAAKNQRAGR